MKRTLVAIVVAFGAAALPPPARAEEAKVVRARDLGIPFDFGEPGRWNAITDVPGVEVGHVTLIEGDAVRTGVTAVLPRGKGLPGLQPCFAGFAVLNGAGDLTGTLWVDESGFLEGPVLLTDTSNVGVVRDAVIRYAGDRFGPVHAKHDEDEVWSLPVVAETWGGDFNAPYAQAIRPEHVFKAIDGAAAGPVAEGSVGGGTGMRSYAFKSGIGTSSRVLDRSQGGYTVGVLVQANLHGDSPELLHIGGIPVGRELKVPGSSSRKEGSIIVIVATDAPLLPHQLKRLARRASLGEARTGAIGGDASGDMYIAFSTRPVPVADGKGIGLAAAVANDRLDPLFAAVVGSTEEAIVNSLVAARTMTGYRGKTRPGLPHDQVRAILARHGMATTPAP